MKKKSEAQGKPDLNILFIYNMPFRAIAKMTARIKPFVFIAFTLLLQIRCRSLPPRQPV